MPLTRRDSDPASHELKGTSLELRGALTRSALVHLSHTLFKDLEFYDHDTLTVRLDSVERMDSAGVALLEVLIGQMHERGTTVSFEGESKYFGEALENARKRALGKETDGTTDHEAEKRDVLEQVGEEGYSWLAMFWSFVVLCADVTYWAAVDMVRRRTYRQGEFGLQINAIGVSALPIVGSLAFLIGAVLALQATAQLRQFGADRFVVDLTVVSMTREMGPLITAIIVAGRSGAAIAAELATMKVTDEFDALTTMALDPIRFTVVPKMYASIVTMPLLTILANIAGIIGGIAVASSYLNMGPQAFLSRVEDVLYMRDLLTGIVKSIVFGGIIVAVGAFFGMRAQHGAREVGQMTTAAVVAAISLVILADSILGLLFY